jgi:phosphoglycolate phosphatase
MPAYRHVIWDWNGTLLDDIDVVVGAMGALLARRSLPPLTLERYREVFDFPVSVYYEAVGLDLAREPFAVLAEEWIAEFTKRWPSARLRETASDVLASLSAAGLTQSVLSAAERTLLADQARHFAIDHHFDALVGIDDHHAVSKVEHGRRWLADLDLPRHQVLLVGDTTHDVEVGHALGIDVVLVEGGHQSRGRLEATGERVLSGLGDVLDFVHSPARAKSGEGAGG